MADFRIFIHNNSCDMTSFFLKINILVRMVCDCTLILIFNTPIMGIEFLLPSDTRPVKGVMLFLSLLLRLLSDSSDTVAPESMYPSIVDLLSVTLR